MARAPPPKARSHEGAELILGPLFAQEVSGAAPVARQASIPMIAFSSDEKVAGSGVYLLSFLAGRDVPRIVSFALSRGKRNFAELVPQSPYGRIAEAAFGRAVSSGGGQIAVRATFPPTIPTPCSGPCARSPTRSSPAASMRCSYRLAARTFPRSRRCSPRDVIQRPRAAARHRAMGLSQYRQREGSGRRLVSGARPEGLEQIFTQRYAKTYGAAPPGSRASPMTR